MTIKIHNIQGEILMYIIVIYISRKFKTNEILLPLGNVYVHFIFSES